MNTNPRNPSQGRRRGAYAFFADNTLTVQQAVFDARLNEAILLHGGAGVADVWTVDSLPVAHRLDSDDGTELLRQGLVFALRRDTVQSFKGMFDGLLAKRMFGVSEAQRSYVRRLEETATATTVTWSFSDVRAAYCEASDKLFTEEVLQELGVSPEGASLLVAAYKAGKAEYEACTDPEARKALDVYTNTWIFERVTPEGTKRLAELSLKDGELIWRAARTMYQFNVPSVSELAIAAEDGFSGLDALAVLRRHMKPSANLLVKPADISAEGAFQAVLGDLRVAWLFSPDVIGTLSAEELTAATRVQEADDYHVARGAFLALPSETNWLQLVGAMKVYLTKGADEIIRLRRRNGHFRDPKDVNVQLIGAGGVLRMESDDAAVAMSGLPANFKADPVQVIGQHVNVPIFGSGGQDVGGSTRTSSVRGEPIGSSGSGKGSSAKVYTFPSRTPSRVSWPFRRAA